MNNENNKDNNTEIQNVSMEENSLNNISEEISDDIIPQTSENEDKIKKQAEKDAEKEAEKNQEPFSLRQEIFEWVTSIIFAIVVAFLIKGFIFDIVRVDGNSMFPTLHNNDRLIITKLGYSPKQGDIIILDSNYKKRLEYKDDVAQAKGSEFSFGDEISLILNTPEDLKKVYYVKRVIATEGQTVDLKGGKVYVDGKMLDEPYYDGSTNSTDASIKYPLTVEEGNVFVMGDNRNHSTDSRSSRLGQVPVKAVIGKSQIRVFPFTNIGTTK